MVTITSLNQTTEINQHLNQNKLNSGTEAVDNDLAHTPPEVLRALNLSSVPLKSTVDISKEEAEKRHAIDKRIWKIGFTDIFRPVTLFNKIFNKILYPFQKSHRSDFDPEFRNIVKAGIPLEKHLIKTSDKHSIELWFARNPNPEAKTKIYLHGNGSTITNFKQEAIEDYRNGNNICLFSYRAYSGNHGYPSEEGLIDDTNSVIDFLKHKQSINPEAMDFEAHSLGCAVLLNTLVDRIKKNPEEKFGNILLMSPFKSIQEIVKNKTKIIPRFLINLLTNAWNNYDAITKLRGKIKHLKIIHGDSDKVIPTQHSRDLYKEAQKNSISSELIELKNIGHNDIRRDMLS